MTQIGLIELGGFAGALLTLISLSGWIIRTINKQIQKAAAPIQDELAAAVRQNREAAKMSLKYSITRAHEEYIQNGKIGRHALQCIHEMHDQYKELGGNGFVEALVGQLHALPIDIAADKNDVPKQVQTKIYGGNENVY